MKVILKEPGFPAYLADIPNELEDLQEYVGGYIEAHTLGRDLVVICNEEGRNKGLPQNCVICGVSFVGPVILCSQKDDDFADIRTPGKVMPLIHEWGGFSTLYGLKSEEDPEC